MRKISVASRPHISNLLINSKLDVLSNYSKAIHSDIIKSKLFLKLNNVGAKNDLQWYNQT